VTRPPIVDAHCDLLLELAHATHELGEANPFAGRWMEPLARGGVAVQACALYIRPELPADRGLRELLRLVEVFGRAVRANGERVVELRAAEDLDAVADGRIGLLLTLEGAASFGSDPWLADVLADLGVRMASLTWNEANAFAGGCGAAGGLTALGEQLVDRLLARGVMLDLAHASDRTFADVVARIGDGTVLVSHAGCRAVYDHPRNVTDAQLRALAEHDGVLGVMAHPLVVDPARPDVERLIDHVDHAVEIAGIDHVGLGGDFMRQIVHAVGGRSPDGEMPYDAAIEGLEGPEQWPAFADALARRGYDAEARAAVLGGNMLRLLRRGLAQATTPTAATSSTIR